MSKTWIDSNGVERKYVKDAYVSFRLAYAKKQQAKKALLGKFKRLTISTTTKPVDRVSAIQSWARSQKWSSYSA